MIKTWLAAGLLTAAALAGAVGPAAAHPHVWIDAAVILHRDDAGRIAGIEPVWIFDDLYSQTAFADLDADGSGSLEPAELQGFAKDAVGNLRDWNYFVEAKGPSGAPLAFRDSVAAEAQYAMNRLILRFRLALSEPLSREETLNLRMYDPSYYMSIEFVPQGAVTLAPKDGAACETAWQEPDEIQAESQPLLELLGDEATLSAGDNNFGGLFAKTLRVTC